MSMSEQRTSRRKFGTPTTSRKIGLPIKSVRLLLSYLFKCRSHRPLVDLSCGRSACFIPSMFSVLYGQIPTQLAGEKCCTTCRISPFAFRLRMDPKRRTRKLDQSNRNRHSPRTSVRGLSSHPQRHQLHSEFRGHAQTRITPTCSTTHGLSQRHHLARAALGRSTAQGVLNKSSRGGSRGVDFMGSEDRLLLFVFCVVVVLFLVRRALVYTR